MRVAIVNDTMIAVEAIRRVIAGSQKHEVAWIARNGAEAVEHCASDRPDLILMDLFMPVMNGVEATRQIMTKSPCAILIVTASTSHHSAEVFSALGAGALDVVKTPIVSSARGQDGSEALLTKISTIGRLIGVEGVTKTAATRLTASHPPAPVSASLVAIGCSAGGPAALARILHGLPKNFPAAVVVVQHVDEQFAEGLATWLAEQSAIPIRLAREGDHPTVGSALMAARGDHLIYQRSGALAYTSEPVEACYRPSVDVFFESLIGKWTGQIIGVLLTGMGRDGARGLKALRDKGCHTIAQDKASCAVYGMPKAAADINAAVEILPLDKIVAALTRELAGNSLPRAH